jgi:hypothetical protein
MGMGEVTVARIMTVEAIGTVMRTVTAADEARTETVPFPALYRVQPPRSNSHFSRPEILKQMQPFRAGLRNFTPHTAVWFVVRLTGVSASGF